MHKYHEKFMQYMGAQALPDKHQKQLYQRAQHYISLIAKIGNIEMIAVCNSLSYYGATKDSDIDLFIVTRPGYIWWVRFRVVLVLWWHGVWRAGEDIAGNFCTSFFITTEALNLQKIAIEQDIYLYYWIWYLKPIVAKQGLYEQFLQENSWVKLDATRQKENQIWQVAAEMKEDNSIIAKIGNKVAKWLLSWKFRRSFQQKGCPYGVVANDVMQKFHDRDRRIQIREAIHTSDL